MLPSHILKAAKNNQTSLGDNPCFPPEDENKFIVKILSEYYENITSDFNNKIEYKSLQNELSSLINNCKKIEDKNKETLEKICVECVYDLFKIPDEVIEIEGNLVNKIDTKTERLLPEKTTDYTFDSIEDINFLSDEIYKRRVLNSIIAGASLYYANNFKEYFQRVFEIDPELPSLYKKIMAINNILLYLTKDSLSEKENNDGGKVEVYLSDENNIIKIKAEALIFPILLNEIVKGLLELAISHGLPEERTKALYIIGKSDFKLSEIWDMRIGCPLWELLIKRCDEINVDIQEIGINFLLMKLSMLKSDVFNESLQEIFANTNKGKRILHDIIFEIKKEKEKDEFDEYISTQHINNVNINDDEYFEADELITDNINVF